MRRPFLPGLIAAVASFAFAANAQTLTPILIDINTGNGPVIGSDPDRAAPLTATQSVFTAFDQVHGREPWITDGTPAGTHLLADICPGTCSSSAVALNPDNAVALGVLYLAAEDGEHGKELWKVTSAGVVSMVKDINPGALGSNPGAMAFRNNPPGQGFFSATSAATGAEVWKTDGTAAGTLLVKDIVTGAASSTPCCFGGGLNKMYFRANTAAAGAELYMTDGSDAGTVLHADIQLGPASSGPSNLSQFFNDNLMFTADDGIHGYELWLTTPTATTLIKDIDPGTTGSNPTRAVYVRGKAVFSAQPAPGLSQLWTSDTSSAGTQALNLGVSQPAAFVVLGSGLTAQLLLLAPTTGSPTNQSLYVSDGTNPATAVATLGTVAIRKFVVSGSLAYLLDANKVLTRTDGTGPGTFVVHDFGEDNFVSVDIIGAVGANKLLLTADDGFIGNEPYAAGPNKNNVVLLKNIAADLGYSDPQNLTNVNGTLFFSAFSEETGRELWKVSDPAIGAQLVADIVPGAAGSSPGNFIAFNGKLYFVIHTTQTAIGEVYVSDGTALGTHPLKNLGSGATLRFISCMTNLGDHFYFNADGGDGNNFGAWVSDGTDAGTIDIHPQGIANGYCSSGEPGFARAGAKVLFEAGDSDHGYELFRTDGTAAGTALVRDIDPGPENFGTGDSNPSNFVSLGAVACFSVTQGTNVLPDTEPWCSDGTAQGTQPLGDLNPGSESSTPLSFTRIGDRLAFSAFTPDHGRHLYSTDGTAAGTISYPGSTPNASLIGLLPVDPSLAAPDPPPLPFHGNVAYFACTDSRGALCQQDVRADHQNGSGFFGLSAANDGAVQELHVFPSGDALFSCWSATAGRELCRFNSTLNGGSIAAIDVAIADIAPGIASSSPEQITPAGAWIYFSADDGTRGRELWALRASDVLDRIFADAFE